MSKTDGTDYRAEKYTYDKNGNVLTYTNQEGTVTTFTYDGLNRVISESITVSGKEQTRGKRYDRNGNVLEETDEFGNKTTYTYDPFDRLLTVTAPDGTVQVTYTYNGAGDCDSMTDANGYRTIYYYVIRNFTYSQLLKNSSN